MDSVMKALEIYQKIANGSIKVSPQCVESARSWRTAFNCLIRESEHFTKMVVVGQK